jgi:hypothetical protein
MSVPLLSHLVEQVLQTFSDEDIIDRILLSKTTDEEYQDFKLKMDNERRSRQLSKYLQNMRPLPFHLISQVFLDTDNKYMFKLVIKNQDMIEESIEDLRLVVDDCEMFILQNYDDSDVDLDNDDPDHRTFIILKADEQPQEEFVVYCDGEDLDEVRRIGRLYITSINNKNETISLL